jgi:hypothetical protein
MCSGINWVWYFVRPSFIFICIFRSFVIVCRISGRSRLPFAFSFTIGSLSKDDHLTNSLQMASSRSKAPRKKHKVTFIADVTPSPRPRRAAVPDHFQPVYVSDFREGRVARYRCTVRTRTLTGEIGQCSWVGRKQQCANHKKHVFILPSDEDPLFNWVIPLLRNLAKLNKRILETAAEFVTATSLSCRQAVSPAMQEFILSSIQIGASFQANDDEALIDVAGLLETINEKRITEAIRKRRAAKFAEAIVQLSKVRFANLVVDAGTVHSLKTIVCRLTNPHYPIQPLLLALRENTNFTADDYATIYN